MDNLVCFVCNNKFPKEKMKVNKEVFLPICQDCMNTKKESESVRVHLDSLAEGFVCGCI